MAVQKRIIPRILSWDTASSIWKFMGDMGRIGVAIVVSLVPICLAYLFLRPESEDSGGPVATFMDWLKETLLSASPVATFMDWLKETLLGASSEGPQKSATDVLDFMERLPTEPAFYYSITAFVGIYLGWRWYLSANLREEIRIREVTEDENSLTSRDWWVVQGLRGRALAFRTLAGVLLGGVVALLFGGIYIVLFVIPQVLESDRFLATEIQRAEVKQQFGRRLQLIGEGRYWFEVADVGLGDTPISESEEAKIARARWPAFALRGRTNARLPVLNTHEVSQRGLAIFATSYGKALVALDGGQTWSVPMGLEPEEGERIAAATFGPDGRHGVVGGLKGSVFVTQDGGQTWSVPKGLELKEDEWIVAATFGPDGRHGVVGGLKGSVFVTQDGGQTWSVPKGLELKEGERIAVATFGPDGRHGVVGSDKGSVFVTQDGGQTWSVPKGLELKEYELIVAATFGPDGRHGVVGGLKGSVFVTQDNGQTWSVPKDLELKEGERIVSATFGPDGRHGVVGGDKGSVFVTQDGGQTWSVPKGLELKEDEWIVAATFGPDGRHGVVGGLKGSVFVTQDGGQTWSVPKGLELKEDELIVAATFGPDGRHGVVGGLKGSVFVTQDRGQTWSVPKDLELKEDEWIVMATFDADDRFGVVAGSKGSVFVTQTSVTQSSGLRWNSTELDHQGTSFIDVVSAIPEGRDFVAVDGDGGIHLLKAYPDMAEWENRSLNAMRIRIQEDEILRKSVIGREITKFLARVLSADGNVDSGEGSEPGNGKGFFSDLLDELTVMRVVTLIILFFLAQTLVRLHQYSLRLATFWDSRADALLLAQSFAYHNAATFDDLVAALAPDAYDFKPTPKSGHEAVTHLAGQLLRRESRKS